MDVGESRAAAAKAVELVREGKAELVMKGSLTPTRSWARWWRRTPGCAPVGA
jgi:hypothetical protein